MSDLSPFWCRSEEKTWRDRGSKGPLDLQSNAVPTELSQLRMVTSTLLLFGIMITNTLLTELMGQTSHTNTLQTK